MSPPAGKIPIAVGARKRPFLDTLYVVCYGSALRVKWISPPADMAGFATVAGMRVERTDPIEPVAVARPGREEP